MRPLRWFSARTGNLPPAVCRAEENRLPSIEIVFSCHLECGIKKLISQGAGLDVYYQWRKRYLKEGTLGLMNHKNITPGTLVEGFVLSTDISSDEINQLKAQMQDMQ